MIMQSLVMCLVSGLLRKGKLRFVAPEPFRPIACDGAKSQKNHYFRDPLAQLTLRKCY